MYSGRKAEVMGLFDKFKTKNTMLERLAGEVASNMANNYKDAAQEAYRELIAKYGELSASGALNEKQKNYYEGIIQSYSGKLKDYTHKDQKPYWTGK